MKTIFVFLAIFLYVSTVGAKETRDEWTLFKSQDPICKSPAPGFEVKGDFDSNGSEDVARLQVDVVQKKRRLAVWMNGEMKPLVLDEKKEKFAGNYLSLKSSDSLSYGTCEASEVIYKWNKKLKKFEETRTSD